MTPRAKASVDVAGATGVASGGGTEAVAAGADEVALVQEQALHQNSDLLALL